MTILRARVSGCTVLFYLEDGLILEIDDDRVTVLKQRLTEIDAPKLVYINRKDSQNGPN